MCFMKGRGAKLGMLPTGGGYLFSSLVLCPVFALGPGMGAFFIRGGRRSLGRGKWGGGATREPDLPPKFFARYGLQRGGKRRREEEKRERRRKEDKKRGRKGRKERRKEGRKEGMGASLCFAAPREMLGEGLPLIRQMPTLPAAKRLAEARVATRNLV